MILDLGLNPHPYATGETTVKVSQRIIMNHYTAKRLIHALGVALQRHETAFGSVENRRAQTCSSHTVKDPQPGFFSR